MITKEQLVKFEEKIKKKYSKGLIRAPVHLSGGNEEELIDIFKKVKEDDWVLSTWRSHYHSILKSQDFDWVEKEIVEGRSIHLNSKKHKIYTSAIVSGILPIAVGMALAIKRRGGHEHVWCFVGDMGASNGTFYEAYRYAEGHELPITFVVENNKVGVNTPTKEVWGNEIIFNDKYAINYDYERIYPHHGINEWITFDKKEHNGVGF